MDLIALLDKGPGADADAVAALLAERPMAARVAIKNGDLPLHIACGNGAPLAVVRAVLDAHPDAVREKNFGGKLPLNFACAHFEGAIPAVAELLLERHPKAAQEKDGSGLIPLLPAAFSAPAPVVLALLAAWPEGAREKGIGGRSALHRTCDPLRRRRSRYVRARRSIPRGRP